MAASRFPQLQDREWLQSQADANKSINQVAREIGCTHGVVTLAAHQLGVTFSYGQEFGVAQTDRHARARAEKWPQLMDRDWLFDQYVTQNKTLLDVAKIVGSSIRPVVTALQAHGIEARANGVGPRRKKSRVQKRINQKLQDRTWLQGRVDANATIDEMATEANCSAATVGRALADAGIERLMDGRPAGVRSAEYPQLADKEWLATEYTVKGRKAQDMADEIGCKVWAVQSALSRFRVLKNPSRPQGKQDSSLPVGTIRKDGYILVWTPEHPNANGKGYVPQHRLICEEALGRYLTPQEEVHHCNENRSDNRIENLIAMPDYKTHMDFHRDPPAWVPRCECCARVRPELVASRPAHVPLVYDHALCYGDVV